MEESHYLIEADESPNIEYEILQNYDLINLLEIRGRGYSMDSEIKTENQNSLNVEIDDSEYLNCDPLENLNNFYNFKNLENNTGCVLDNMKNFDYEIRNDILMENINKSSVNDFNIVMKDENYNENILVSNTTIID